MPSVVDGKEVNQQELAQILGKTAATIKKYARQGMPVLEMGGPGKPGRYNTAECIRWVSDRAVSAATGDIDAMQMDEARRRKVAADAAMAELDLAKARGDVVEIEHVGQIVADEYAQVRANFMSMPGSVAADLAHRPAIEIQERLADKVSEILDALTSDQYFSSEEPSGTVEVGGSEAPTEAEGS